MKSIYFIMLALLVSACATPPSRHKEFRPNPAKGSEIAAKDRLVCIRDSNLIGDHVQQFHYVVACMAVQGHELVDVLDDPAK